MSSQMAEQNKHEDALAALKAELEGKWMRAEWQLGSKLLGAAGQVESLEAALERIRAEAEDNKRQATAARAEAAARGAALEASQAQMDSLSGELSSLKQSKTDAVDKVSHGLQLQSLWIIPMDNPYCSCKLTRGGSGVEAAAAADRARAAGRSDAQGPAVDPGPLGGLGGQGESRLTAAVPMDNPYCSCELTRVLGQAASEETQRHYAEARAEANAAATAMAAAKEAAEEAAAEDRAREDAAAAAAMAAAPVAEVEAEEAAAAEAEANEEEEAAAPVAAVQAVPEAAAAAGPEELGGADGKAARRRVAAVTGLSAAEAAEMELLEAASRLQASMRGRIGRRRVAGDVVAYSCNPCGGSLL